MHFELKCVLNAEYPVQIQGQQLAIDRLEIYDFVEETAMTC